MISHNSLQHAGDDLIPLGLAPSDIRTDTSAAASRLLADLERGASWTDSYARFWTELAGTPPPTWPPQDARINWLWLTDIDVPACAVDIGSPLGDVAGDLNREFQQVVYVGAPTRHGAIVQRRFGSRITVTLSDVAGDLPAANTADCVTFVASPGCRQRLPAYVPTAGVLVSLARTWLRPGGWFVCLLPNAIEQSTRTPRKRSMRQLHAGRMLRRHLERGIADNGFSEVRQYLVAPGVHLPLEVVPYDRAAIGAFHNYVGEGAGWRTRLRGLVPSLSFPARLIMARL